MGFRYDVLVPGEVYHVYTRGVEKRSIFISDNDRGRVLSLLLHCMPKGQILSFSNAKKMKQDPALTKEGEGLVDLLCYCIMDNHLHLLLKENVEGGTSLYMQRLLNSYAKYFNMKEDRSGSLFVNPFKAVLVDNDEQLLHVSRYIHVNPYVARMVSNPFEYEWSSLSDYVSKEDTGFSCHKSLILSLMKRDEYRKFVESKEDYIRSLDRFEYLFVDIES